MTSPPQRSTRHPHRHSARRRRLLAALGAGSGLWAAGASPLRAAVASGAEPPRLALLIGNRDYPGGQDLPPIHKNVHDLHAALEKRGFEVTDALDADLGQARERMQAFAARVRSAPPESTVFFYFSGHGAQVDAENLLVSAHVDPRSKPETLIKGSLVLLADVVGQLPHRPSGLTIAVVDACRTSLKAALDADGLNQVEAPPGCLIAFATGAGKPAIAPADDTRNTFYTASLVKLLTSASDEISFSDLFRLVKTDVQQTMLNHPVKLLREFAQFPFIAENTQVRRLLAPRAEEAAAAPPPPRFSDADEAGDWTKVEAAVWPAEVAKLAKAFLDHYPKSRIAGSAQVALDGAEEAAKILRRTDVRLYRSAFQPPTGMPDDRLADLAKAGRGDKDAAARLGRYYGREADRPDSGRYEGWMQYAAALGNGIASYELARYYERVDQPQFASQYRARALALGYTPPPSLDNTRK